jgi:hypothetical protein
LKTLLQSLSFEILFSSSQKQTFLDQFLKFFEKLSRIYQENSQAKPKNLTLVSIDTRQVAKHDQAEWVCFLKKCVCFFFAYFIRIAKRNNLAEEFFQFEPFFVEKTQFENSKIITVVPFFCSQNVRNG